MPHRVANAGLIILSGSQIQAVGDGNSNAHKAMNAACHCVAGLKKDLARETASPSYHPSNRLSGLGRKHGKSTDSQGHAVGCVARRGPDRTGGVAGCWEEMDVLRTSLRVLIFFLILNLWHSYSEATA